MLIAAIFVTLHAAQPAGPPIGRADTAAITARAELDSALAIVRRTSLWRDTATWAVVEPEVRAAAAGATTPREAYLAIRLLLRRLGDHHSALMEPAAAAGWSAGPLTNADPLVGNLGYSIGSVALPGYSGGAPDAVRAYAQRMHQVLAASAPRALRVGRRPAWQRRGQHASHARRAAAIPRRWDARRVRRAARDTAARMDRDGRPRRATPRPRSSGALVRRRAERAANGELGRDRGHLLPRSAAHALVRRADRGVEHREHADPAARRCAARARRRRGPCGPSVRGSGHP